jgi:hypothetical protein
MTKAELQAAFDELELSQAAAAALLSVDARTIRRWFEDVRQLPGSAEQALRAWVRLNRLGLAWKPDDLPIGEDDTDELAKQIALYRQHAIQLEGLLKKVEARGGPMMPWNVDLDAHTATLGHMTVGFYRLPNGGFSPSNYRRSDRHPEIEVDAPLLEDAYACIAKAIAHERRQRKSR